MNKYASVMEQYSELRGTLITPAGWDQLLQYGDEQPNYQVIDEAYTAAAQPLQYNDRGDLAGAMADVASLMAGLSSVLAGNARPIVEITSHAGSFGSHIDSGVGDVYLSNFDVNGAPYYEIHPVITGDYTEYEDDFGTEYSIKNDPNTSVRVPIKSRQLVILNSLATLMRDVCDNTAQDSSQTTHSTTLIHAAHVPAGSSRDLVVCYASAPNRGDASQINNLALAS